MSRRSPGVRPFWLAAIALQVSLPGAAALADARIERAAAAEITHIESQAAKACVRVHPPDCALCRFLTTTFEGPRPLTLRAETSRRAEPPRPTESVARAAPQGSHPHPRAPAFLS